ncbi:S8 family peptidase [Cohnella fermenti]|uniref:S8 family peptidase n=1 Tax=Cohnella fermenti TaxID=2565925 RepID=UPI001E45545F|nr:S8 family peptidase [Cohnella fermenti]
MRRNAIVGLLFTAGIALMIAPLIAPPKTAKSPAPSPSPASYRSEQRVLTPQQEHSYKQMSIQRDMDASEKLCRLDCSRDVHKFVAEHDRIPTADRASHLKQIVAEHPHMVRVEWVRDGVPVREGDAKEELLKLAASDLAKAETALKTGKGYESASFKYDGKSHFVIAVPDESAGGDGVVALVCTDIVQEVERHQRRNLRVVPYPAEGRYRLESVIPGTNKDTTVRTGEDNGNASHYAVDEIVVKFRKPLEDRELLKLRKELDLTVVRHRGQTYLFRSKSRSMDELKHYFTAKWNPIFAEPHYLYLTNVANKTNETNKTDKTNAIIVPNDTLYSDYQWNLPEIATEQGWTVTRGANDIVVAVVDTGVQLDHPDLQGRLVEGRNIIDPTSEPLDDVGHGTHVAGIIAAKVNNNEGIAGMTWETKIMPVKVLDSTGAGTTYSVAEGIIWATDHGANVINMSLGNYASAEFLHDAVKYAHDKGVVLVAASGNDNTDRPGYPAAYPEVFAVAATNEDESKAEYSNYGDYIDVAAPGTSIASTYPGSRYAALSGTSMASPHVAALASLVRAANPSLTNEQVMELLRSTAKDLGSRGRDNEFGYGQIDAGAAVAAAGSQPGSASGTAGTAAELEAPGGGTLRLYPQRIKREVEELLRRSIR